MNHSEKLICVKNKLMRAIFQNNYKRRLAVHAAKNSSKTKDFTYYVPQ